MNALLYTDGSGVAAGGPAGIGYVAFVDGVMYEGSLPLERGTNQQAELLAAAYALTQIEPCDHVTVFSDSEYVVKGMTEWVSRWEQNGWKTGRGKPVMNQRHWQRLLVAVARHRRVQFRWVRGHNGHAFNERADVLAGLARAEATDRALLAGTA